MEGSRGTGSLFEGCHAMVERAFSQQGHLVSRSPCGPVHWLARRAQWQHRTCAAVWIRACLMRCRSASRSMRGRFKAAPSVLLACTSLLQASETWQGEGCPGKAPPNAQCHSFHHLCQAMEENAGDDGERGRELKEAYRGCDAYREHEPDSFHLIHGSLTFGNYSGGTACLGVGRG